MFQRPELFLDEYTYGLIGNFVNHFWLSFMEHVLQFYPFYIVISVLCTVTCCQ